MKIALITDTHFGARNDSLPFNEYFYKFWEDIFFPYIDKRGIDTIIHLGDTMDRRKFVSYKIANDFRRRFLQPIIDRNIDTHILIGNHDTYYKNTNEVNSLAELIGKKHENIKFYEENCTVNFGNTPIFFCPWINTENYGSTMKGIQATSADTCMGHLEINGFEMHKGHFSENGYPKEIFKKFDTVFSGHFHKKSVSGNVTYLGNAYQLYWNDLTPNGGKLPVININTFYTGFISSDNNEYYNCACITRALPEIDYQCIWADWADFVSQSQSLISQGYFPAGGQSNLFSNFSQYARIFRPASCL